MSKPWPQILFCIGVFLALFGFASVTSDAGIFGVAIFLLGAAALLIGGVAAVIRFAIRRHMIPHFLVGLAALILIAFGLNKYCFSLAYIRGAHEDPYRLWISALKPFGGLVYYVGSEGEFSYFRAGAVFPARFKAPTAKIKLPRTFPLGTQEPYTVTAEMVSYSALNKSMEPNEASRSDRFQFGRRGRLLLHHHAIEAHWRGRIAGVDDRSGRAGGSY
jgi:hypothetical protein